MILRPILADSLVWSVPVDPSAVFEAGNIFGLIEISGEVFAAPSDGINIPPIGIVDDIRSSAFSGTALDEITIIPAPSQVSPTGELVSTMDVMGGLQETEIIASTFSSNVSVVLNPKKGTFIIPAGSLLNYDDGSVQGFEVVTSYRYTLAGLPGLDSTIGTGQVSIHFKRGIFSTNMFDVTANYYPGQNLYVNSEGFLTAQETGSPAVAVSLRPASAISNELVFMWL